MANAREQIDDDAQIQPALMGFDIGDVGHPDLIRRGRLEPLLQPVLGHHRWLAAIAAGTTPVADLRSYPGQRRQPSNMILRDAFALVTQVVGQLAISIDLAALSPGLPDQLGLTCILPRTVA